MIIVSFISLLFVKFQINDRIVIMMKFNKRPPRYAPVGWLVGWYAANRGNGKI